MLTLVNNYNFLENDQECEELIYEMRLKELSICISMSKGRI